MDITNVESYFARILGDIKVDVPIVSPFISYSLEDKSKYKPLCESKRLDTRNWIDKDNDFLSGDSGGILMNMNFIFINTKVFTQVADNFMLSAAEDEDRFYIDTPDLSTEYIDFWDRELIRRREGMTAKCKLYFKDIEAYYNAKTTEEAESYLHDLHITGDHYNYLNYGRIERTPTVEERNILDARGLYKQTVVEAFPRFWDGDYWNFKLDLLIQRNDKNLCKAKARRKGFSYKRGSQAANTVNLYKKVTVTLAAYDKTYLTKKGATTSMAKLNLDWYERHTDWVRGYISENIEDIVLGYKESSEGHQHKGFLSGLYSVGCQRNESAAIGKKAVELDLEEAGKFPNIQAVLNVTLSNLEVGTAKIGTIRAYGTAGTKEANWFGFKNIFYNPKMYNMLELENIYDSNKRHTVCGYFFPQILNYEPYIDEHGNSKLIDAYYDDLAVKEEYKRNLTGTDLIVNIGQRANSPEEAFNSSEENIFTSYELDEHILLLSYNDEYKSYIDGQYELVNGNVELKANHLSRVGNHPFIEHLEFKKDIDVTGCWREYYPPFRNDEDILEPDQYAIVYDPYGIDKDKKELKLYHSLASIQVWSLPNCKAPYGGDILVAEYSGRHNTMEAVDRIFWLACMRWKSKGLVEINKGDTVSNFSKWGVKHLLMRNPISLIETGFYERNAGHGVSIQNELDKLDYIREAYDFLYAPVCINSDDTVRYRLSYIKSIMLLRELQTFSLTGNFDRISTLLLYIIYRRAVLRQLKDKTKSSATSHISAHKRTLNLLHGNQI
jgi:hypothetical protein